MAKAEKRVHETIQKGDSLDLKKWKNEVFNNQLQLDSIKNSLVKNFPAYKELRFQNSTIKIATIQQKLLLKNEAFLQYFEGDHHIYIFYISKDETKLKKLNNNKT